MVLQNQLYHIMFCEDQAYADFASVDRFIKSHITILAITQKLDPQSFNFMLIWLVLKVQNIPTVVVQNRGRATAGAPSDSPCCRIGLWEWPVVSGSVCVASGRRLRLLPVLTTVDTPFGRRLLYCRCGPSLQALALLGVVSGRRFDW